MAIPRWQSYPVISGRTARWLLEADEGAVKTSLDLGLSKSTVQVCRDRIALPGGELVDKGRLANSFSQPGDCVQLRAEGPWKIYISSNQTRKYYKLHQPFEDRAPTIIINNATMHSIVDRDPWEDEARSFRRISVVSNRCSIGME